MFITKQRDAAFRPLPCRVQIEPAGQCNLNCIMCLRRSRTPASDPALMKMDVFRALVEQFPRGTELHLQGLGEPLLHPQLFEMVSFAVRRGMRVTTNSNMTLLDPERAEACVKSGLAWVRISIDGATADTYEAIRRGSHLALVLRNIELLVSAKQKLGSRTPALFLVMVLMRRNVAELNDVIRLAHAYALEEVFVQHLCFEAGADAFAEDLISRESLLNEDPRALRECFREAASLAASLHMRLRLPGAGSQQQTAGMSGRERCDWPWRSAYIAYDGTAMPCCLVALPERMNFGNMAREGVALIWRSAEYEEFRAKLRTDDPPAVCRTCSVYHGTF